MNEFFTQAQLHNDCLEIRYLISRSLNFNGLNKLIIKKKHLNKKNPHVKCNEPKCIHSLLS